MQETVNGCVDRGHFVGAWVQRAIRDRNASKSFLSEDREVHDVAIGSWFKAYSQVQIIQGEVTDFNGERDRRVKTIQSIQERVSLFVSPKPDTEHVIYITFIIEDVLRSRIICYNCMLQFVNEYVCYQR